MPSSYEKFGYAPSGARLTATLSADFISIVETAAFFNFLNDTFRIAIESELPGAYSMPVHSKLTTSVNVESGSIKAVIDVIKGRQFLTDVASSVAASIVVGAATFAWPADVVMTTPRSEMMTENRLPIDPQLTKVAEALNASGRPWTIELTARDPRLPQELRLVISGNQGLARNNVRKRADPGLKN